MHGFAVPGWAYLIFWTAFVLMVFCVAWAERAKAPRHRTRRRLAIALALLCGLAAAFMAFAIAVFAGWL